MPDQPVAAAASSGSGAKRVSIRIAEAQNGFIVNVDRADSFEFRENRFVED